MASRKWCSGLEEEQQRAKRFSKSTRQRRTQNPHRSPQGQHQPKDPTVALPFLHAPIPTERDAHENIEEGSVPWKTSTEKHLLVVQQQHDWVQFFAGPIVRTKGDNEVIESIPSRLCRNDNQFVLKPVGFGVFKAVVLAALCGESSAGTQRAALGRPPTHGAVPLLGGLQPPGSPIVPCPASGSRMGLSRVEGGTEWGSSQCRESSVGSLSRTCSREKIQQREDMGRAFHVYNTQT